ncbi:ABC transporter substrate-binding protein [Azospirillum isscasi]|uniref:ABC transporter substrate-binding protein n=1 Tax=Azospirillum isscasi TaxID=3053926 RepID=A0ABU0WAE6_9PROT|nr:ABC transporter substrate-binding protein [Azospirillum isscasi]MDQ2101158.1 ABC transporter substrate-binding protein [Azospirillum isscasi]
MTFTFSRRLVLAGAAAIALSAAAFAPATAQAQGTLRIGMTAADIPLTHGSPDNGFEGFRFAGYTMYDGLVNWDLSTADKPSAIKPGLALSWEADPKDTTKWTFKLRPGVKFHDGSAFDAKAVAWNFDKLLNKDAPHFDARQASLVGFRAASIASYKVVDDLTIEFTTKTPDSFLPYQLSFILMASPAQYEAVGKDWAKFAAQPSGTGPFKLEKLVPRERAELAANKAYWDTARVPKLDKLVLIPMPEANTRTAALLSGQVDVVEAPPPDTIPRLKSSGMQISSNPYPHIWPYHLSRLPDSPWNDVRVRKAANLAIDREGLTELLGGYAVPAKGHVVPGSAWYGKPSFDIKYDLAAAKKLMAEAGYGPGKPVKAKAIISPSGSGQMLPLPMNEFIQQNLKEIGIELEFEVMEITSLINRWRAGAKAEQNAGASIINFSYATVDPFNAFVRFVKSDLHAPNGVNWGFYADPAMDALAAKAQNTFDKAAQDEILGQIHAKMVDDALFVWVVHDVAPRALSPKVKGFVQAQNWFLDLSPVTVQ